MTNYFAPVEGLTGGFAIGAAAAILLLCNGDILGASGLVSSTVLQPISSLTKPSSLWKLVFISAFLLTSLSLPDQFKNDPRLGVDAVIPINSALGYTFAGLFTGFGTKLGNGCTSGHGICGLARLSKRSFVAVGSFMASAIVTAVISAPSSAFDVYFKPLRTDGVPQHSKTLAVVVTSSIVLATAIAASKQLQSIPGSKDKPSKNHIRKLAPAAAAGSAFAFGLARSQMVLPSRVFAFLNLAGISNGLFDPTLAMVMGGGVVVSWLSYQFVSSHKCVQNPRALSCPAALCPDEDDAQFSVPNNATIDARLIGGAACFGIGWGLGGVCPGPALFQAAAGFPLIVNYWWPAFFAGSFIAERMIN